MMFNVVHASHSTKKGEGWKQGRCGCLCDFVRKGAKTLYTISYMNADAAHEFNKYSKLDSSLIALFGASANARKSF